MILPNKIEIGGFTYSIIVDTDELENKISFADSTDFLKRIRIKGNLSGQQLTASLLHEFLHCIDHTYLGEVFEEKQIEVLANGLYQVLKQLGFEIKYGENSNQDKGE